MARITYRDLLTEESLKRIESLSRDGATNEQVAEAFGINVATLYSWKKKYTEIDDALKRGKRPVDFEVENMLLKSAMGFEYEEEIMNVVKMNDGSERRYVRKLKKYQPPNVTAQIFWLKNRKPEIWRDKRDLEVEDKTDIGEKAKDYRKFLEGLEDSDD